MRVLVGCEESGKVRDAFNRRGHDAVSNDLLPSRNGGAHLQMDVFKAIQRNGPWDIIILFPDCTKMSLSGNRWYGLGSGREQERRDAVIWTTGLWHQAKKNARIGAAIENPTSVLWGAIGRPQYIQPHDFGHGETKKTGILTDRLPRLVSTHKVPGREQRVWKMPRGPNRKRDRAETYDGVAEAMAAQWGAIGKSFSLEQWL